MAGFGIDKIQADYIAEIKLRNLNKQYILNRISEIEALESEIAKIEEILADELKIKALISSQLAEVKKKYAQPRRSQIISASDITVYNEEDHVENYNTKLYLTKEGYFKKITLQSLRGNDEQKLKDGDEIIATFDADNLANLIFITDKCQLYRAKAEDFDCVKASTLGEYLPTKLDMDEGEKPVFMRVQNSYPTGDNFIFIFENGKGVRIPVTNYETKSNRKKLINAYSDASPICAVLYDNDKAPIDIMMISSADRAIIFKSSLIPQKNTRTSGGVSLMTIKKDQKIVRCTSQTDAYEHVKGLRKIKIPATGQLLEDPESDSRQLKIET